MFTKTMNIYTSYYSNTKKLLDNDILPIAISLFTPKDLNLIQYKDLVATYQMFKKGYSWDDFRNFLKTKNPYKVLQDLKIIADNKDFALLCYELDSNQCHRHIVSEWFNQNGIKISEFEFIPKIPCLSIQQPWAELIISGKKNIENRDWSTNFRGEFFIHTGKTFDIYTESEMRILGMTKKDFTLGGIVGKANLIDVVTESDSKWFCGRYGFVLDNIQRVDFIPMAGKLGFFEFDTSRQYLPKKISPAKVVKVNLELWRDVILSEQPSMFA